MTHTADSERLWKAAVELEEKDAARVLLTRAVEDGSVDMFVRVCVCVCVCV